jgi:N-acetylmuramoyl-L-alanine amidase CwlA
MPKGKRNINKIIIHHSASPQSTTVEQIRDWHVNGRGWSDIGYHFIVLGDGTVANGRHINRKGAHCYNHNGASIGICVTGNTSQEPPTQLQLESLWGKVKLLMEEYNLDRQNVYGHRDFGATECPGNILYALIQQWKQGLCC